MKGGVGGTHAIAKKGIVPPGEKEHCQVAVWRGQGPGLLVRAARVAVEESPILSARVGAALCLQVALAGALAAGLVLPGSGLLAAIEQKPLKLLIGHELVAPCLLVALPGSNHGAHILWRHAHLLNRVLIHL